MHIIDTHCDALWKMQMARRGMMYEGPLDFRNAPELDTNLKRLKVGGVKVQFFAVFLLPDVPSDEQWQHALEQVDIFYTEILGKNPEIKQIRDFSDINKLKDGEIGAVLTLEGTEAIGNDLMKLRTLYRLGVRSVGLTWNNANLSADGCGEARGAGLTEFGKKVVALNNEQKILTDVSHLSDQAFWDVLETARYPFASHSNARAICEHPRNLSDEMIKALIEKGGFMHVVFFPNFIKADSSSVAISDLIRHIDHICSLGGEKHIGFGSDFDGIDSYAERLESSADYPNLINELLKYYSEDTVRGFAYENFLRNAVK